MRNCDDREDACGAIECIIARDENDDMKWVQCDQCKAWIHAFCAGVEHITPNDDFICESCK